MVNLLSCLLLIVLLSLHCFVACLAANTKNITTDQHALLVFKSLITSDPYDMLANNWSTSSSVCNWVGVTCDERHSRVYSLILQNMSLRGTVSPNLGNLSFLVILDLKNNSFGGQFPTEVCRLRRLKVLHISYNEFEGGIPAALWGLSQLQYLYLGANNFTGFIPESIGNLQWLKELHIGNNRLSGPIPQTISNMSSLEVLNLFSNYFSGEIPKGLLGDLTQLKTLSLEDNQLSGNISMIFKFNNSLLDVLNLNYNKMSGNLPSNICHRLPNLRVFDIYDNDISGEMPTIWHQCEEMGELDLSFNSFNKGPIPDGIQYMAKLQNLYLIGNNLEGEIPSLNNMTSLRVVKFGVNNLNGRLPNDFFNQLPQLQIFTLNNNQFEGSIPQSIGNCTSLLYLSLSSNFLTGEIPKGLLGDLTQLKTLSLEDNQLSGNISMIFKVNNSVLEDLNLYYNNIFGNLPSNICHRLPNLRGFNIYDNDISGEMPTIWHQCEEMDELDLSFNSFNKGPIPDGIQYMTKLQNLHLIGNNLEGEIPSLNNMTSLRVIEFGVNNLNGRLPNDFFNQLPQLKSFTLNNNQFEGSIPQSIGNCTSLIYLDLSSNFLTGTIPEEIGYLDKLHLLQLSNNSLSGSIPSKIFNLSSLAYLEVDQNSLSGTIPSTTGCSLPNLQHLHLYQNNFVGNLPNNIFNSSKLRQIALEKNAFSGTLPNTALGDLGSLEFFIIYDNNLTIDDSHQFFTSLTNCRYLKYLELSWNHISNLPKSIGNLTSEYFGAELCGIDGNIPQEVGNMSNLIYFNLYGNNINGPIPGTFKGLQKLQQLILSSNGLQGSFIEEFCEMKSLGELFLSNNKLSGVLPTCLGNMISLIRIHVGSNSLNSRVPSSLWSLRDILEINFSSNSLIGNLPPEIGNLRAIILLDLSRNQISSNIPTTISPLQTLQKLSLADNKLNGSIPESLGQMISLISLDLSQNMLTGVIPKSLESLVYLQNINFSYNRLQGEIPDGGQFKNFTAQSFMHNGALCGNPRLQVPKCGKQVKKWSMEKKLIFKCILPIVVSVILVVACIILLKHNKRKNNETTLERGLSTLGAPRRISYYEIVEATNGFNEGNFLGRGGFGSVYQGKLLDGEMIAVKVIDLQSETKSKSFDAECNAMRNLRHRNLVKIISSCSNLDFKSLVMEFMSNGSVDSWLYSNNYCLSFLQRLNIMIDVASALEYLHHGSSMHVVHCDLKPSNVLLDENMVAHVSDFGIAKLMDEGQSQTHTQTLATVGYLAPEYGSKGIVSVKGDVYSYGIMLMEIFTRKKPTDDMFVAELSLKTWISGSLPNSIMEVLDSNLVQITGDQIDDILTHMSSIFSLALNCCEDLPEARINMADVIATLNKIKTLVVGTNTV